MQNKRNSIGHNVFRRFANKYTLVGAIFAIWVVLFDKYSVLEQFELRSKINDLKQEKRLYQEKIEENKRKQEELTGDRDKLEKFAREEHLMKRENEDIFIIINE